MTHTEPSYQDLCRHLMDRCGAAGFDLIQPAQVGWYNDAVDAPYQLPDLGAPENLVVIVGNTRALWPRFLAAIRDDASLAASSDPLHRYTEACIGRVVAQLDAVSEIRYSHEAPPRRVAMQELARVSGLAHRSPSYLSVHPVYGPWIGLRAAIVLDLPGPSGSAPIRDAPCTCADHCDAPFQAACAAMARASGTGGTGSERIAADWRIWVAVRDACPVGREHRYSDAQIEYHYTKNRALLRARPDE